MRRFVTLWAFAFWQGGFLFYAGVVVTTAAEIVGHKQQGFVTRWVALWINVAGVAALAALLWDTLATPLGPRRRRLWTWAAMAALLVALSAMHLKMFGMLDPESYDVERGFRPWHRWYLRLITLQWALSLVHSHAMLAAWRQSDGPHLT